MPLPMQLAPSERALLHAEHFAGAPSFTTGKEELLLRPESRVARDPLGHAVLAAAVLGAERAGLLRLELRPRKALFGLRTVTELWAVRAPGGHAFPAGSFEDRIAEHFGPGERTVRALLHDALESDASSPTDWALALVKRGLAQRDLLERRERKTLKVFTTTTLLVTDRLRTLAEQEAAADVRAVLDACERERPAVWAQLRQEIGAALAMRQESSDTGPDFD